MTAEGEQQEAVCGRCGERLIWSAITQTWRHAVYPGHMPDVRTATVPAPVVPSDDECEFCGEDDQGRLVMCERHAREYDAGLRDLLTPAPPTPTSSLEEARERVRLSHNYACDAIYPHPPSPLQECNCGAYRSLLDFEAAARAEVIREVLAWVDSGYEYAKGNDNNTTAEAYRTFTLFLRALFQGGEGKA